jgi:hypothetical protein
VALPKLTEDLAFISKLGDYPSSDNNLTPDEFKAQFDAAALLIQAFLNDKLIPGLDQIVDVEALLDGIIDKTLTQEDKAADAKSVGDELKKMLLKSGDTMTGSLNMNGFSVTNLPSPVSDRDAVRKDYVDNKHDEFQCVANAANWSGNGPYTQVVAVQGILSTDKPIWGIVYSSNAETALAEKEDFACVDDLNTANGSVTLTCYEEKPEVNLTIQMEVNR